MEDDMPRQPKRIGIEEIKTAQRVRSIPRNSEADLCLELYMLLKKKERLEKMSKRDEWETIQKQIGEVKDSLQRRSGEKPRTEEKPTVKESIKKIPRKNWKVIPIDY